MTRTHDIGAPPGSVTYIGREISGRIKIVLIQFNEEEFFEEEFYDLSDCIANRKKGMVKWINVEGVHNTAMIEKLGKCYNLHSLTQEDIVHIDQRPKFEEYD